MSKQKRNKIKLRGIKRNYLRKDISKRLKKLEIMKQKYLNKMKLFFLFLSFPKSLNFSQ